MFTFTLSKVNKLGEFDATYGQRYWGEVTEDLTPVSFNSKHQDIKAGDMLAAEEKVMKKSSKGTQYWQYKKVRLLEEGTEHHVEPEKPAERPQNAPQNKWGGELDKLRVEILSKLAAIEAKLDKLLGIDETLSDEGDNYGV